VVKERAVIGSERRSPVRKRVLVVDDMPGLLRLTERYLKALDYDVLAADHPRKAIDLVAREQMRVDLLLTDVVMPEMSGPQLFRQLEGLLPGLRCLYMSGYPADVIESDIGMHNVAVMPKPFTREELAEKLEGVLGRKDSTRETE